MFTTERFHTATFYDGALTLVKDSVRCGLNSDTEFQNNIILSTTTYWTSKTRH